jgi:hypothetical protein
LSLLGIAVAGFVLVLFLAARASRRVGRMLRKLKAEEYSLWSELSIWQTFLEPGRTVLVLDRKFWSRVKSEAVLVERAQALRALGLAYGASAVWGGCLLWFVWRGGAA